MKHIVIYITLIILSVPACGESESEKSSSLTRALTASVDQSSFPAAVERIELVQAGVTKSTIVPNASGSFSLNVPTGANYQLKLMHRNGSYGLVFPRKTSVDRTFSVPASTKFDLGKISFVGKAAPKTKISALTNLPKPGGPEVPEASGCENNDAARETNEEGTDTDGPGHSASEGSDNDYESSEAGDNDKGTSEGNDSDSEGSEGSDSDSNSSEGTDSDSEGWVTPTKVFDCVNACVTRHRRENVVQVLV